MQQCRKAGIVVDQIGQSDLVERGIEGINRVADRIAQPAGLDQGTGVGGAEAFRKGQIGLEHAEHGADIDFRRRAHQLQPAMPPARRVDEIVLAENSDHLAKVVFRGVAGRGDIALAHRDVRIDGAEHQGPDGQIGPCGEPHSSSFRSTGEPASPLSYDGATIWNLIKISYAASLGQNLHLISPFRRALSKTKKIDSDPARRRLGDMARQDGRPMAVASGFAVISALLWIPQAWLVAQYLAALVETRPPVLAPMTTVLAFVGLGLARHLGEALAGRKAFHVAQRIVTRERTHLIARESLTSPFAAQRQTSAALATLLASKLDVLMPFATRYRLAAIKVSIVPAALLIVVTSISWVAALVLLVAGPLIPVFMALIGMAARDASEKHMVATGTLNSVLLEWLNAAADIRLLNAEQRTVDRFRQSAESLRARTMEVLRIAFLSSTVLELFSAIGIAMVAVYVGFSLLGTFTFGAYTTPLSIAEGIFVLLLVPDFFQPLRDLASAWHDKAAALAVAGELAERESEPQRTILGTGGKTQTRLSGSLTIATTGLRCSAGGREIAFPDIRIMPGEKVAVVGPSGAGKTTLIALLAGLVRPSGGQVDIAGQPLDDDCADAWRSMIGFVGQHPHMLNASLRANIALVDERADAIRLEAALHAASADGVVDALPRGTDTRLGENGSGVSGGEARRLMIARAIYADARVIFADEPTADLDTATADRIIAALEAASRHGATLVVATHDPRLIARLDRVIRLGDAA